MASAVGTRLSRDDFRKAKELEELRKTGAAPPELDPEGRIINPHIPQYISAAPWYYHSTQPSLKHQYLSKYQPHVPAPSIHAPNKRLVVAEREGGAEWVAGACANCGSRTHGVKECLERPRKRAAKYGGEVVGRDEWVEQEVLDYDGKRDRWKGYDSREYSRVIERYDKQETERKKKRLQELELAYQQDQAKQEEKDRETKEDAANMDERAADGEEQKEGDATAEGSAAAAGGEAGKGEGEGGEGAKASSSSSDAKESDLDRLKRLKQERRLHRLRKKVAQAAAKAADPSASTSSSFSSTHDLLPPSSSDSDSSDSDAAGEVGSSEYRDYGEVITKMDGKSRTTVRNLRIREDTAKYLRNLNPNSAHYDPKTRSMRQNPHPDKQPHELLYAGDNFVRGSGDVKEIARMNAFVWDNAERAEAAQAGVGGLEGALQGVEVHAVALPSAAEKLYLAHKQAKEQQTAATKHRILSTYGGEQHLARPAAALLQYTEAYVEYDDSGRVIKGAERAQARSRYAEDVMEDGHSAVWGSWWDRKEAKWGYACCRATLRHCICVGEVGRTMKAEMDKEREKREVKQQHEEVVKGDKRKREEAEEERKVAPPSSSTNAAAASYSQRYSRPPSESELEAFHRSQHRMDDPIHSMAHVM